MDNVVTLRPVDGSRSFYSEATQYQKVLNSEGADTGEVRNAGEYTGERFPRSKQEWRVEWSYTKNKFPVDLEQEELNKLVKQCRLKYEKGPHKDHYIEEADPYNFGDPFFNHTQQRVLAEEGAVNFNLNNPMHKIIANYLPNHPEVKVAGSSEPYTSARIRYILSSTEKEKVAKKKKRDKKRKAFKLYENLTAEKKKMIAVTMKLGVREGTDPDVVEDALMEALEDDQTYVSGTKTKQDLFIELCEAKNDFLTLRYTIRLAINKGIIRKKKNGYSIFGNIVAQDVEELEGHLRENEGDLERIEQALKDSK